MVAFCVLFIAQEAGTIWLTSTFVGVSGAEATGSVAPFAWRLAVFPATPAFDAGLRTGDIVNAKALSPEERFRLWSTLRAGERVRFPVIRGGRVLNVFVTPQHEPIDWALWLAIAAGFWAGICALILVLRRPESREVRILVFCLLSVRLGIQMNSANWVTPFAASDAVNAILDALMPMGWALLATYVALFVPESDWSVRSLKFLSYLAAGFTAAIGVLAVAGAWYCTVDPEGPLFAGAGYVVSQIAYFLIPLLCALTVLRKIRGAERERVAWVVGSIGIFSLIWLLFVLSTFFPVLQNSIFVTLSLVLQLLSPLGLTYAMLNRRLLDIGFVINRAVVYAGVSFVVVGVFVLVEWGFGEWFSSATHVENLTVSAVLALVLGLSVRAIHHRVNLLLDSLLFRKRHENEKALHRFAREAPYITDPSILITRTAAILEERADASFAVIEADDGAGSYGEVDENDEAIVSLRTSHRVLDLQDVNTRLPGEFAYPMIARGRLVGVLVLGSKRSGESYAPDESEAIEALAQSVGGALDALLVKNESVKGPILEAIRSVQASVNVIAERLRVIEERG